MTERERLEKAQQRYLDALHSMQAGVSIVMHKQPAQVEPKHLRVGVNSAMVETSVLTELLIARGLFTLADFMEALATRMEEEANSYAEKVSELHGGTNVKLI